MKIVEPRVSWLGGDEDAPDGQHILELITEAGRVAYQSERTGGAEDFVRNLIRRGHESVLEHCKLSVIVTCDRGISHETVRHRIASYTMESTRYCNYANDRFEDGISYINLIGGIYRDPKMRDMPTQKIAEIMAEWADACLDAERHYNRMIELGATPQIARSVLNHSTKTALVMTMNLREWRLFFKLRNAPDAHPQMREIAEKLLEMFKDGVPVIFEDIK